MDDRRLNVLLPDFQAGPLDFYRQKASFNWKRMKVLLESEEVIQFQKKVWKILEGDPLFHQAPTAELTRQECIHLCFQQHKRLMEYEFFTEEEFIQNPAMILHLTSCLGMYDWSLSLKRMLGYEYFIGILRNAGTKVHLKLLDSLAAFEAVGCLAITEIGHGTNTRGIQTTAIFDKNTQEFVLNTPNKESVKTWAGNLGSLATHAVVFAQLYTPDGTCHGLHSFLVPVRDPKTLKPFPNLILGDMGPKLGLNGLDNGYLIFCNYRIPHECLLSRTGNVTADGKYITKYKDPSKRFGASLVSLSLGRITVMKMSIASLQKCLPIAIRYSAVRCQFGPTENSEIPILEYQLQQWRLLPYLAATYVLYYGNIQFCKDFFSYQLAIWFGETTNELAEKGAELHALCCAGKPLCTWLAQSAIQECREACGGHGYLQASGFGILRNDNDAQCTYEGDNNVLLQQTSNYLIGLLKRKLTERGYVITPQSVTFLNNMDSILQKTLTVNSIEEIKNMKTILSAYQWLVCYLLKGSYEKLENEMRKGENGFMARNNSQVYFSRPLSLAFFELSIIQRFYDFITEETVDVILSSILKKVCSLYALWSLEKHLAIFYEGEYFKEGKMATLIKEGILSLCSFLKNESVALVDVIAPPDFILNSVLGNSDGQVYKHLYNAIVQRSGAQDRPFWWREFLQKPSVHSIRAKL